jgi:hypothetical protein
MQVAFRIGDDLIAFADNGKRIILRDAVFVALNGVN